MPTERDPDVYGVKRPDLSRHKATPSNSGPAPFTPEQEARIRQLIAEGLAAFARENARSIRSIMNGMGL